MTAVFSLKDPPRGNVVEPYLCKMEDTFADIAFYLAHARLQKAEDKGMGQDKQIVLGIQDWKPQTKLMSTNEMDAWNIFAEWFIEDLRKDYPTRTFELWEEPVRKTLEIYLRPPPQTGIKWGVMLGLIIGVLLTLLVVAFIYNLS